MTFVDQVRKGLAELQRLDPRHTLFAAGSHRYQLGPTVSADEVAAIEARYGFRFPDDYRSFVLELGAGGAGPGYGVFAFGMIDDGHGHAPWQTWKLAPGEPFPHRTAWNDVSILERGSPSPDDFESEEDYEAARDAWRDSEEAERAQTAYWSAVGTQYGCIPLCHHGCALRDWLVVTGPEAGHVWHDGSADTMGIEPVQRPGRERMTFADWYLDWVESSIAKLAAAR